jgi:hypothetical protein
MNSESGRRFTDRQHFFFSRVAATASAPARTVLVTQKLDPNLDWSTVQLGAFSFGGQIYSVPAGLTSYNTRINATSTIGVYVDVTANIDEQTGVLTWTFTSIDPKTLDQPIGNPLEGFLPPDVNPPEGEGWVSYSVRLKAGDTTGTTINAQATVVFDQNAPIKTPQATNTIDAGPPTSSVAALPHFSPGSFTVSWAGQDDPRGSGVANYDVYVSDDDSPFTLWQSDTTKTSATYTGQSGHTYGFYSVATDNVGNVQTTPTAAQATTTVDAIPPTSTVVPLPSFSPGSFTVGWSGMTILAARAWRATVCMSRITAVPLPRC